MTYTATNPVNFRNKTGSLSDKLGTEFKNIQTEFDGGLKFVSKIH